MKRIAMTLTTLLLVFAGSATMAQDTLIEYLVEACEADLEQYCSQVTPGEGRLLHCMAAHEDKISGRCEYAFYQAATMLEQVAAAITYVAMECKTDIEAHCGDIAVGEGRIMACLSEHGGEITEACKKAISDTVGE